MNKPELKIIEDHFSSLSWSHKRACKAAVAVVMARHRKESWNVIMAKYVRFRYYYYMTRIIKCTESVKKLVNRII